MIKSAFQHFSGGLTLIDVAIVFAVVAVVGLPSFETAVVFAVVALVGTLALVAVLVVLVTVRVVGLLLRGHLQNH